MDPAQEARRQELAKEARRLEEDSLHSGARHFAAGQRWRDRAFAAERLVARSGELRRRRAG